MARTSDPHSATAQFFINVNDNKFLNHKSKTASGFGYAVFGKVVKGMSIVNRIKKVKTQNSGSHSNVPVSPIIIKKAYKL
jgi:peptidyl-prolyl cis-trans isomerase B (cyclophilin B)